MFKGAATLLADATGVDPVFPDCSYQSSGFEYFRPDLLDDLLNAPNTATRSFFQPGYGTATEFWGPNYGARFGPNGEFIGFL
jgi:hypothetical protein